MSASQHKKRRMSLLKRLAELSGGRHDKRLSLSAVSPGISFTQYHRGTKFTDEESPSFFDRSDAAYDFQTLEEEGLIGRCFCQEERTDGGEIRRFDPGVTVKPEGFAALQDAEKSFVRRAIEQQPLTAMNLAFSVFTTTVAAVSGWFAGHNTAALRTDRVAVPAHVSQPESKVVPVTDGGGAERPEEHERRS